MPRRGSFLALVAAIVLSRDGAEGWPSLYTDCSVFPELGEPQFRPRNHAPMALLCEPLPPASFEWCATRCSMRNAAGTQNCSDALCDCNEHCMGTADVCTGAGAPDEPTHRSLPDTLSATPGATQLRVDGAEPAHFRAGATHCVTIVPPPPTVAKRSSASPSAPSANVTWYLLDSGVGDWSVEDDAGAPDGWRSQCGGARASFSARADGAPIALLWTAPLDARTPAIALRVATATTMGDLAVSAAVLHLARNKTAAAPSAAARGGGENGERGAVVSATGGYFCATSAASNHTPFAAQQCASLPVGTRGALNLSECVATCLRDDDEGERATRTTAAAAPSLFHCARCAHVYDPEQDGGGLQFEELPANWTCPACGAPKSAFAKQVSDEGARGAEWVHAHEAV